METEIASNRYKGTAIVTRNYIGRIAVYFLSTFTILPELYRHNGSTASWIYAISIILLFPHIAYFLSKNSPTPQKTELKIMVAEGVFTGAFFPLISVSLLPIFSVILPSLIYSTFYRGLRFYSLVLAGTALGVIISCMLFGYEIDLSSGPFTTFAGAIFIPLTVLALVIFIRADYEFSRKRIRESKQHIEEFANKLSKYLSPQVYSQIFLGKKDVRIESYRKKLSIFFSDIRGFTSLTDSMESEELSSLLNNYFNEMAKIAIKYGGTIDKYIGDSIMIFFGDPESQGIHEDAKNCVQMAIEMRFKLNELREKWINQGLSKEFRIRMGINTGYCTVGNFGSEDRLDYTIIGGQVNLASRLESSAAVDQILISHETYALVKDSIACVKKGEIMVKGIAYPIQTYEVLDTHANLNRKTETIEEVKDGYALKIDLNKMKPDDAVKSLQDAIDQIESH